MNPEQTASLGSGRMINQLQSKISQKCPKTKQSIRIFNFPEDVQRGEVQINKSEWNTQSPDQTENNFCLINLLFFFLQFQVVPIAEWHLKVSYFWLTV